jgi:ribonucleoside-diphosphate reductase alpha chain
LLEEIKAHDGSIQEIKIIPQQIRDKYKEAFEIEPEWLIKAAAARGKWIDQSQSLNLFINTNSGKRISDMYLFAWKSGLKTTYYLRTLAASSVEKSTVAINRAYGASSIKKATTVPDENGGNGDTMSPAILAENAEPMAACAIDDPECEACQ